jgi:broad-specificity NMP kinase
MRDPKSSKFLLHPSAIRTTYHLYTPKMRRYPNIIVAGTPAVGKTTTVTEILSTATDSDPSIPLRHLSINDLVKSRSCHEGYDEELQTYIVDDDKLMDEVEKEIEDGEGDGGWVIDWHSVGGFAVRWVDLVVVLRCEETEVLFDRLSKRDYKDEKIQENMDAEIFGVIGEEAREAWEEAQVVELKSVKVEDVEENAERVVGWIKQWLKDRQEETGSAQNGSG